MVYVGGLGDVVSLPAGQVDVGKLQAAINRVITGARGDSQIAGADADVNVNSLFQAQAQATSLLNITGTIEATTSESLRAAATIASVISGTVIAPQVTTTAQLQAVTAQLNAAAAAKGYPITDPVGVAAAVVATVANALTKVGVPPKIAGISTTTLAIGIVAGGAVLLLLRHKPTSNPARRRHRRRR